ncbi:DUF1266 domain-containing protein [Metabacillus malikii]|uniref:mRNA-degrading endonuclease RelE of RelBE toxin-antitoxin system n=1 Tax=Metabacillus malikii TaxID=1504265 RepID=A0ABT9ZLK4_9BACI|nr:DUF1266 domain-containing protein [Metabacillus malikii]MDQ0233153.1 mRNA-degrading endonuclease RelE of RelBE toxin-antitoxin system [Metabacillus malikii]
MTKNERERRKQTSLFFNGLTAANNGSYYEIVNQQILPWKSSIRNSLKKRGILDTTSFKKEIHKMLTHGQQREFKELRNELLAIPKEERLHYVESFEDDSDKQRKLKVVHDYFYRLPESTIAAFDYTLYIVHCTYGAKVGLITKEEAWNYKLKAARLAQKSYSGWLEYISAYYAGSQFHTQNEDGIKRYYTQYTKDISKLVAAKHSPINKVQWNIEL